VDGTGSGYCPKVDFGIDDNINLRAALPLTSVN
jgi:hypothetical protein